MNCTQVCAQLGEHLEGDLELDVRAKVDQHLAGCKSCARELRALRRTVSLLRGLPTPEVSPDLTLRVMERIRAERTPAAILPLPLRRLFDPRVAIPLAAGISALVLFATLENRSGLPTRPIASDRPALARDASAPLDPVLLARERETRRENKRMWDNEPVTLARRDALSLPHLLAIERTAARRFFDPTANPARVGFIGRTDPVPAGLDLDSEIDGVMRDPMDFVRRVSAIEGVRRGTKVAPLALRAGHRGVAGELAGRLRSTSHPLAHALAERFEIRRQRAVTPMAVPASHR